MTPKMFIALVLWGCSSEVWSQLAPRDYRGANYLPSTTHAEDNVRAMLPSLGAALFPGQHVVLETKLELKRLALSRLNTVRLFPSFWAWVVDRPGYWAVMRDLVAQCNAHGMKITYVVWNAIGVTRPVPSADGAFSTELWHELPGPASSLATRILGGCVRRSDAYHALAQTSQVLPPGEPTVYSLHVEPGNELFAHGGSYEDWPYGLPQLIDAYLADLGAFFASDPFASFSLAGFDLFNEPNGGEQLDAPIGRYLPFIKRTHDVLRAWVPNTHFTVGWAGDGPEIELYESLLRASGVQTTYASLHSYSGVELTSQKLARRASFARGQGVDLVVSEIYRTDINAGVLKYLLNILDREGLGGQVWGVLQTNAFTRFDPFGVTGALDGLYIPTPSGNPLNPIDFPVNNPVDEAALRDWAAGTLVAGPYAAMHLHDVHGQAVTSITSGVPHAISFTSTQPVVPVIGVVDLHLGEAPPWCGIPNTGSCLLVPGVGFIGVAPSAMPVVFGMTDANGYLLVPAILDFPLYVAGGALEITAVVGDASLQQFSLNTAEPLATVLFPIL